MHNNIRNPAPSIEFQPELAQIEVVPGRPQYRELERGFWSLTCREHQGLVEHLATLAWAYPPAPCVQRVAWGLWEQGQPDDLALVGRTDGRGQFRVTHLSPDTTYRLRYAFRAATREDVAILKRLGDQQAVDLLALARDDQQTSEPVRQACCEAIEELGRVVPTIPNGEDAVAPPGAAVAIAPPPGIVPMFAGWRDEQQEGRLAQLFALASRNEHLVCEYTAEGVSRRMRKTPSGEIELSLEVEPSQVPDSRLLSVCLSAGQEVCFRGFVGLYHTSDQHGHSGQFRFQLTDEQMRKLARNPSLTVTPVDTDQLAPADLSDLQQSVQSHLHADSREVVERVWRQLLSRSGTDEPQP